MARNPLLEDDYRPMLSDHGHLRDGWLKKAFDAVVADQVADAERAVFVSDDAAVRLGVNQNMAQSMRHWVVATGIIAKGGRSTTSLGRRLFGSGGLDPWMEHPATLWLMHWQLCSKPRNTIWYWAFSHGPEGTFKRQALIEGIADLAKERAWARASATTIDNSISFFMNSYAPQAPASEAGHEDVLMRPLVKLKLIQQTGARDGFQFARGPKPTLGAGVFAYAVASFWATRPDEQALPLSALAKESGSPGRVFLLNEDAVTSLLGDIEERSGGAYAYSDVDGIKQLTRKRQLAPGEALGFIAADYRQPARSRPDAPDSLRRRARVALGKVTAVGTMRKQRDAEAEAAPPGDFREVNVVALERYARLWPVVAKRHYHRSGALRWFDVKVIALAGIEEAVSAYAPRAGAMGGFLIALPTRGEPAERADDLCRRAAKIGKDRDILIGLSPDVGGITDLAAELSELERQREGNEPEGDQAARNQDLARIPATRESLENALTQAFDSAAWHRHGSSGTLLSRTELNDWASDLADARFKRAPRLHNEILGRIKPSTASNAIVDQRALLQRMVSHEKEERLGIEGFLRTGGLFASLLEATGLHRETLDGWRFVVPEPGDGDDCNLAPMWQAAEAALRAKAGHMVAVSDIHDIWRKAPFGVKDGLLPVLSLAFMLSRRNEIAWYRQDVFQASLSDGDIDDLIENPVDIQMRWIDMTKVSRRLPRALTRMTGAWMKRMGFAAVKRIR